MKRTFTACAFASLTGTSVGAACIPNPAQQVTDTQSAYDCVSNHWGQPWPTVIAACSQYAPAIIADVIADITLLLSKVQDAGVASVVTPYSEQAEVVTALAKKLAAAQDADAAPAP